MSPPRTGLPLWPLAALAALLPAVAALLALWLSVRASSASTRASPGSDFAPEVVCRSR